MTCYRLHVFRDRLAATDPRKAAPRWDRWFSGVVGGPDPLERARNINSLHQSVPVLRKVYSTQTAQTGRGVRCLVEPAATTAHVVDPSTRLTFKFGFHWLRNMPSESIWDRTT